MRLIRAAILSTLLALCLAAAAFAQSQPTTIRVATRLVKPFVYQENGELQGFSIELWREIGRRLGVTTEFLVKDTVQDLLQSVKSNESALGIAAISITSEREKELDLSQPMFEAGLQILVPSRKSGSRFTPVVSAILSSAVVPIVGIVIVVILIAHLVWFFERGAQSGLISTRSYFPGIFDAGWWAASTLATQADQMPRTAWARMVAVFWMFSSIVFIAYFTAAVTSSLTVQQLRGDINGPEDLPGRRVLTVAGSTSAEYLQQHRVDATSVTNVDEAFETLSKGQADAIVYDAPVLLYYASRDGRGKTEVVGAPFRRESYGVVFPADSRYRKLVNTALLNLKEDGTYDRLYGRWFGTNQ